MSSSRSTRATAIAVAVIIVATVAAYSNSFTPIFAGADAKESIRDNPHIRSLWPLSEAMSLPLLDRTLSGDPDAKGGTVVRRPMLSLSFALTRRLLGPEPWGFHAVNLAIHIAAALALFGVARRTLLLPWAGGRYEDRAHWLALALASLWLVHPVQTESVTYLVQRAESQMGLLYLLTLYCAVRGFGSAQAGVWFACSTLACALGMGTKETMVTAPVVVALYDRAFVSGTLGRALAVHRSLYIGLAACWSVLAALLWMTLEDVGSDFGARSNIAYALAQPGVILHYIRLAFWPHPLHLYVSTEAFDVQLVWQALPAVLAVAALLAATARGWARRNRLAFAGVWFFAVLAPTSTVVATSDVIQEHRMYLALAAVIAVIVMAADAFSATAPAPSKAHLRRLALAGVATALVLASIGLTRERNRDYHDEFSMVYPPDLHEQYMILTQNYLHGDRMDEAAADAAATLDDPQADQRERVFAGFYLGVVRAENDDLAAAARQLTDTLDLDGDFAYAHRELCSVLRRRSELVRATRHCHKAISLKRRFPEAHNELGMVLVERGDTAAAMQQFERALALWPGYADAHFERGVLLENLGDHTSAAAEYEATLRLDRDHAEARRRLAELAGDQGKAAGTGP